MLEVAVGLGAAAGMGLGALATYYPNAPLFGPVIGRGPRTGRSLYLTFDDGPNADATPAILDALERLSVPATFFMVGTHVLRFPALAERARNAGHEIGNHTTHHRKLHRLGPRPIHRELAGADRILRDRLGTTPRLFRAPHGYRNPWVTRSVDRLGYRVLGWTFGVWDSDPIPPAEIRRRVRRRLKPGAVILLHDGDGYDPAGDRRATAAALPGIIEDARQAGYEFRPVSELLAAG
jgi:peptidoglycan/xylan/chitin deacetylase (PgdA/CDA1 family)